MDRRDQLKQVFLSSRLPEVLKFKTDDYKPVKDFTAVRFHTNKFRIRAIEIWEGSGNPWFRIYYSHLIAPELKLLIDTLEGYRRKTATTIYTDYFGEPEGLAEALASVLIDSGDEIIARATPVLAKNSIYEGLELPDVDVADTEILGRTFNWKELLAIDEDVSEENELKRLLSRHGVYLQRSPDGKTRYVGSAYSEGGILGRWMKHLTSNGHAKHLNLYVLENGYASVLFTVLEFTESATAAEARWKETLGTRNAGPYDGLRLNSN
jgi:hypothetical protein